MKIEMGESLLYSWLRHDKECQITQLNWKPSPNWIVQNQKQVSEIMEITLPYFKTRYGYDLFGKNNVEQLIKQAEIDVLGISDDDEGRKIYAVDVAFHSKGLNYGSRKETIERVLKKCVRSSMCLLAYFNINNIEIVFASPKIGNSLVNDLNLRFEELNKLFDSLGYVLKFKLIANDDFNNDVLTWVTSNSEFISDTSEYFLRSYQLYNLFQDKVTKQISPPDPHMSASNEIKIGKLVRTTMKKIMTNNLLSEGELNNLMSLKYSKETFNVNFPILKEVFKNEEINNLRYDANNYSRYYSEIFKTKNRKFLLTSQWFVHSKKLYNDWLIKKKFIIDEK